jgi:hypothetical protein
MSSRAALISYLYTRGYLYLSSGFTAPAPQVSGYVLGAEQHRVKSVYYQGH